MRWCPTGAYVVYPIDKVVELFDHLDPASTRSYMGKHGYPRMIKGWAVEDVKEVLDQRDPELVAIWRDRKQRWDEEENS